MITFEHVSKRYPGDTSALLDVNFHIDAGEMVFLTGHSGAGKSKLRDGGITNRHPAQITVTLPEYASTITLSA